MSVNPGHDNQNFELLYDLIWECIDVNQLSYVTVLGTLELVKMRIAQRFNDELNEEDNE